MDKSVQHRSVLSLPVAVQQDTVKGTWVDATGATIVANKVPMGITENDAAAGDLVAVTVLGTASMRLDGIATAQVLAGDVIYLSTDSMAIQTATAALTAGDTVRGIVLYDAAATGHAEVLLR